MSARQTGERGFPLLGLLVVIFAAAKVFGASTMSWLWVLSPIWLPLAVILGIWLIGVIVIGLVVGASEFAKGVRDGRLRAKREREAKA